MHHHHFSFVLLRWWRGRLRGSRKCPSLAYVRKDRDVRAVRPLAGLSNGVPCPLYYDGRLYPFKNGGLVFCRVAATGELLYNERLGTLGYYYSSPVAANLY